MPISVVLQMIYNNPILLKNKNSNMVSFLQKQGNPLAQGTGNKVTDQEACFAEILESNGFIFLSKKDDHIEKNYYRYQTNGTQKSIDFEVFDIKLNKTLKFDLKHTNSKSFYFNDGWFEKGVIYVISWTPKKTINNILIGYGDDIPTEEENTEMIQLIQFKKEYNKKNKKVGSLRKCIRFANQYSCEPFTPEFTINKFNAVLKTLTLPPQQSCEYKEMEQHSQSV